MSGLSVIWGSQKLANYRHRICRVVGDAVGSDYLDEFADAVQFDRCLVVCSYGTKWDTHGAGAVGLKIGVLISVEVAAPQADRQSVVRTAILIIWRFCCKRHDSPVIV